MIWKEKYRLGVLMIDKQHMELFRRVTDFVETVRRPVAWEEKRGAVDTTLAFMKDYVVTHFRDEEALQRAAGYPRLVAHAEIHRGMVAYVADIARQYEGGGCEEQLMQQFSGKLLAWLINHVAFEDQKIADYINKGGMAL